MMLFSAAKPLNILFISPHVDGYGADRSLLNNVIALKKLGHQVHFIIPQTGFLVQLMEKEGITYTIHPYTTWVHAGGFSLLHPLKSIYRIVFNCFYAFKLARSLKKDLFDIVHTNDLITPFGLILAKRMKCRHVMHSRALHFEQFGLKFDFGLKSTLWLINKNSVAVICNSTAVFNKYQPYFNEKKVFLVNSAIFFQKDLKRKIYLENKQCTDFLFVGRYEASKDPLTAIEAARYLIANGIEDFKVHFFGKVNDYYPDYLKKMQATVKAGGLEELIEINGFDENIAAKIKNFDVALFCSPIEGIARVIVEFMTNGLPVIGTDSGSTPELIKTGVTGFLYKPFDFIGLAEKMEFYIKNRPAIISMGNQAFDAVGKNFSAENTSVQFLEIYKTC